MGFSIIFTAIMAVSTLVVALPEPAPKEYPEVIPGPGLPSLEELGVTSKELYEMAPVTSLEDRSVNYKATCFDKGLPGCTIADAQACVNYLTAKGNSACYVAKTSVFCHTSSGCYIHGYNIGKKASTTSPCLNTGKGAQKIVDSCKNKRGRTEGTQIANGNPNLKIQIKAQA